MHIVMAILAISAGVLLAENPPAAKSQPTQNSQAADKTSASAAKLTAGDAKPATSAAKPRSKRVLFITAVDSDRCDEELAKLTKTGGDFEKLRGRGWKIGPGPENHLQVVDREAMPELVARLEPREFPAVAYIEGDEIVRAFREGCTTPLDMWTFGWLANGIDQRPPGMIPEAARVETTGKYRLRGNHWTIDGMTNPTREIVLAHLHNGFHGSQLQPTWEIESWSYEELRSLHDDLHEKYGGGVSHSYSSSSRGRSSSRSGNSFSASRKTTGR